jgi:hypothetical protein
MDPQHWWKDHLRISAYPSLAATRAARLSSPPQSSVFTLNNLHNIINNKTLIWIKWIKKFVIGG